MFDLKSPIGKALTLGLALLVALVSPAGVLAQAPTSDAQAPMSGVMTLRVQTPAYELNARGLRVPGYGANSDPGAPALPFWSTTVELPPAGEPVVAVADGAFELLSLAAPLPAAPVPLPPDPDPLGLTVAVDRTAEVRTADRPDAAIYRADAFYPRSVVQAGAAQWQGGRRLLPLRVFPFQYNPVAGTLRYYADLRVTVRVQETGDGGQGTGDRGRGTSVRGQASGDRGQASGDRGQTSGDRGQGAANPAALPQAGGGSLRIRTGARGLYGLTYDALVAADPAIATADPATFAVTYLGSPVDIQVTDQDTNGQFESGDRVIFYAEPYTGRYQTDNVYWFTYGGTGSPRMGTRGVTPTGTEPVVTEIVQTQHLETNVDYRNAYHRPKEADHWFDTQLYPTSGTPTVTRNYTLALDDALTAAPRQVGLAAVIHGGTNQGANPDQSVLVKLNAHEVGLYQWEGSTDTTIAATAPATWLDGAPNQVSLVAALAQLPALSYYWISPDYVDLTYPALADADGTDRIYIESVAAGANQVRVAGFTAAGKVYDIRDPRHPVQLTTTAYDAGAGALSFWDADLPGPTYYLSTEAALLAPAAIEKDAPSDWGTAGHTADYIAIVYRDPIPNPKPDLGLWSAIDPLLAHRADPLGDNFSVAKVDVQDVYDEFSYGRRDPEAIRSLLAYAYHNWNGAGPRPQYVLLVGSGTYDFTGAFTGATKPNLIPPYLVDVDPWLGEVPADNRYASVDGADDFLPDMHIGRIPAQSAAHVTAALDKILAYEKTAPAGDWQRRAVYVADDCNNYADDFNALSEEVRRNWLPGPYDDRTVYYGSSATVCPDSDYYAVSDMVTAIQSAFNNTALVLQWFGHGSRFRWGDAGSMFNTSRIPVLNANTVWPITFSYTCWSGYFVNMLKSASAPDYMKELTLAEALLLTAQKGSVADLSPSGQHVGGALLALNEGITHAIFTDAIDRMGAAVDAGKLYYWSQAPAYPDVIDTSILFGDPATRLRLPPLVSAAAGGGSAVKITWKHVSQYTTYRVYRSLQPFFSPEDFDAELAGTVTGPFGADVVFYDNPGTIGDVSLNYYYAVQGVNAFNTAAVSNRVAEFDFALVPGN
jgi:hypothetical protein